MYYAEARIEFAGPVSASLRQNNRASFEEISKRWQAVGNTASSLTAPRFEPQTSRSKDERVIPLNQLAVAKVLTCFELKISIFLRLSSQNKSKHVQTKKTTFCVDFSQLFVWSRAER